jgi:transglutaminase-like putative cysteine protease
MKAAPHMTEARRIVLVGLTTALAAVSTLVYLRYFTGRDWLPTLLGAAVAPAVLVAIGNRRASTSARLVLVGSVLLVPYALYSLYPNSTYFGLPRVGTARAMWAGLDDGWSRLLTVGLPSNATASLLLPLVAITWAASLAGAVAATRRRGLLAPILPAFLAFLTGLVLTASRSGTALRLTAIFLFAAAVLVLLRADASGGAIVAGPRLPRRGRWGNLKQGAGRLSIGIPAVAVVMVIGIGTVAAIPVSNPPRRFDPRTLIHQTPVVVSGISPLSEVTAQIEEKPAQQLYTVQLTVAGSAQSGVDRMRLVALDDYDGSLWTSNDAFETVGTSLPAGPSLDRAESVLVDERIVVSGLSGQFLPTVGQPIRTTASRVAFDPFAGDLMAMSSSSAMLSYENLSAFTRPTDSQLARDSVYRGRGSAYLRALPPDVPQQIVVLARRITAGEPTQIGELRAIERYLRSRYSYSASAAPGASLASVERFLFTTRTGPAEQFATAFALLARAAGFPARVAVGYLLGGDNAVGGGTYDVTTADAFPWPEVDFDRYGWVAFNPIDPRRVARAPVGPVRLAGRQTAAIPALSSSAVTPTAKWVGALTPSTPYRLGSSRSGLTAAALTFAELLPVALGLVLALVVVAKAARRRRRRTEGTAADRVFGAWREVCERLLEHGLNVAGDLTAIEVAEHASRHVGSAASATIATMAPIVTATTFAPGEPDDRMADRAWALEARTRNLIRRDATRWARWKAVFDPRPLRTGSSGSGWWPLGPIARRART